MNTTTNNNPNNMNMNSSVSSAIESAESAAGAVAPCGVNFSEPETRALLRLLANSVDGLLDSGSPNVSA